MDDECRFAVRIVDLDWEMVRPEEMDNTFAKSRISGRALGRVPTTESMAAHALAWPCQPLRSVQSDAAGHRCAVRLDCCGASDGVQ